MSKVDWSLAPEGATHYNDNNELFYRFSGDSGMFWCDGDDSWCAASRYHEYSGLVPRTYKPWSGPEDGLPPVGTICEMKFDEKWIQVRILAEHPIEGQFSRGVQVLKTNALLWANTFRAILTPEQRAADERETAIREIMDVADVDCRVTAARLVDAGFKREVV